MGKRLRKYKVYYSNHSSALVRAYSIDGARRQAWRMLGGFKFGWTKSDFLKKASVDRLIN